MTCRQHERIVGGEPFTFEHIDRVQYLAPARIHRVVESLQVHVGHLIPERVHFPEQRPGAFDGLRDFHLQPAHAAAAAGAVLQPPLLHKTTG